MCVLTFHPWTQHEHIREMTIFLRIVVVYRTYVGVCVREHIYNHVTGQSTNLFRYWKTYTVTRYLNVSTFFAVLLFFITYFQFLRPISFFITLNVSNVNMKVCSVLVVHVLQKSNHTFFSWMDVVVVQQKYPPYMDSIDFTTTMALE